MGPEGEGAVTTLAIIVRLKVVLAVTPPPVAVTVTVEFAAGAALVVLMVNVVEQTGLHEPADNDAIAPVGNPETVKETGWVTPEIKDAVIELETEEPALTKTLPELDKEKLKAEVTVNDVLAIALGLYPLLNAAALRVPLLVNVIAPV